jgi:hypothetical protein
MKQVVMLKKENLNFVGLKWKTRLAHNLNVEKESMKLPVSVKIDRALMH